MGNIYGNRAVNNDIMKAQQFKKHILEVADRVLKMDVNTAQVDIGFKRPVEYFRVVGYFHKTRMHKTNLKLEDFQFLKYLMPAGGYHYVSGEICQNGKMIEKILILKEKK